MMHSTHWTNSTDGLVIFSDGLPQESSATLLDLRHYSSEFGANDTPLNDRAMVAFAGVRSFGTDEHWFSSDEYLWKRVITCLAAFLMPDSGVDDNFEATMERLHYYRDLDSKMALPARASRPQLVGKVGESRVRPDLVLSDA